MTVFKDSARSDEGFSLVELLVVIVIIGVLSAIAIPAFLHQREKAYQSQAIVDMKSAALALETQATEAEGSYAAMNGVDESSALLAAEGFHPHEWISLDVTATTRTYCILGVNRQLPGRQFVLKSSGGTVEIDSRGTPGC